MQSLSILPRLPRRTDSACGLYVLSTEYVSHTAEEGRAVEFVFEMVDYAEVKLTDDYKQLISIVE
jgi:hypothetical protein